MKIKLIFPILFLLASLFLVACFPSPEDECYEERSEEYCDSIFFGDENYNDSDFNDEHGDKDDDYADQDEYSSENNSAEQYAEESETSIYSGGTPTLSVGTVPSNAHPAFQKAFSQHVDVFGLHVYASSDVAADKVRHAAGVMAQYLDNDEDGKADDAKVLQALQAKNAAIFIFARPDSRAEEDFIDNLERELDSGKQALQPLYGEEIIPNGATRGEFDASLEEILHIITSNGYAYVYPDVFGEQHGSAIANAMDTARGGYFADIPASYPPGAWFTYDDETCDYACMITEYHYWALTSLLSGQDFSGRSDEIAHEWRLNTPEKLQNGDPVVYVLLTDPQYNTPSTLPDGNYQP